ncbi:MAG: hypothetical protein RLZZ422_1718 [Pseudomonadota bacterium]|jgi:hypothetical protein
MIGLFILAALGLLVWFWTSTLQAREQAVDIARRSCERNQVQFLDQSVALESLKPGRYPTGNMTWKRIYGFDYSQEGVERQHGRVFMLGNRLEQIQMDTAEGTIIDLAAERKKREQVIMDVKTQD